MEAEREPRSPLPAAAASASAELPSDSNPIPIAEAAKSKAPDVEVRLFRRGRGPVAVFRSRLGGWDQDRLEVMDILDVYGLKSLFAFSAAFGRGVPIRFSPRNGRSSLSYSDGAVVLIDGVPKDSLVKPITKIMFGVAVIILLLALLVTEAPVLFKASGFSGGSFPPWILACVVILFIRVRKRTKDFLKRYGWLR